MSAIWILLAGLAPALALADAAWAGSAPGKTDLPAAASLATTADQLPFPVLEGFGLNEAYFVVPAAGEAVSLLPAPSTASHLRQAIEIVPAAYDGEWAYGASSFADDVSLIPWETAAIVGSTLALGFMDWDWGSSSFHIDSEGFFGMDTISGGMDKLGHAYGSYMMADFFAYRINRKSGNMDQAAVTGALMSWGVMFVVEVMDGFSADHGFAPEDIVMNTIGVTFSYLRNTIPEIEDKLDFRLEYFPSGYDGDFSPHSDYAGQKYVLALKLGGFDKLEDTPARFFELQAGYFTEGFNNLEAKDKGIDASRHLYLAVGINLEQVLFGREEPGESRLRFAGRQFFQRVQIPYTYLTYDRSAYNF